MGESRYHRTVVEAVRQLAESDPRYKNVYCDNKTPKKPIFLNHPSGKTKPVSYYPDVHFQNIRTNRKYVFEVLDSQMNDLQNIISDVSQATLAELVSRIFFIMPLGGDDKKYWEITNNIEVIFRSIVSLPTQKTADIPSRFDCYGIPPEYTGSVDEVIKILKDYQKKDAW